MSFSQARRVRTPRSSSYRGPGATQHAESSWPLAGFSYSQQPPSQWKDVAFATYAASTGEVLYRKEWTGAGVDSGLAMDTAGDVNGDGVSDLLIGISTWVDHGSVSDLGSVLMLSGRTGKYIWGVGEREFMALETFIEETQWEHRLLVLHGPKAECEEQIQLLANDYSGTLERDIVVIEVNRATAKARIGDLPSRPSSSALKDLYAIKGSEFVMLLVGKDGGTKERYLRPTKAEDIWAVIDVMPMRKQEARKR